MASVLLDEVEFDRANPLDTIERVVSDRDWPYDRVSDFDLAACICGHWCDYHVNFSFRSDLEGLHLSCSFDMRVPDRLKGEVYALLGQINERMWLGHFDLWSEEGAILFRYAMPLGGGASVTAAQCSDLVDLAVDACERFYPALQFVLWGGKSADEAVAAAMFETAGEA